jgi:hypothetical protein
LGCKALEGSIAVGFYVLPVTAHPGPGLHMGLSISLEGVVVLDLGGLVSLAGV